MPLRLLDGHLKQPQRAARIHPVGGIGGELGPRGQQRRQVINGVNFVFALQPLQQPLVQNVSVDAGFAMACDPAVNRPNVQGDQVLDAFVRQAANQPMSHFTAGSGDQGSGLSHPFMLPSLFLPSSATGRGLQGIWGMNLPAWAISLNSSFCGPQGSSSLSGLSPRLLGCLHPAKDLQMRPGLLAPPQAATGAGQQIVNLALIGCQPGGRFQGRGAPRWPGPFQVPAGRAGSAASGREASSSMAFSSRTTARFRAPSSPVSPARRSIRPYSW